MLLSARSEPIRILIADDDLEWANYLTILIQRSFERGVGVSVKVSSNGAPDACAQVVDFRPQIILLNELFSHSDGLTAGHVVSALEEKITWGQTYVLILGTNSSIVSSQHSWRPRKHLSVNSSLSLGIYDRFAFAREFERIFPMLLLSDTSELSGRLESSGNHRSHLCIKTCDTHDISQILWANFLADDPVVEPIEASLRERTIATFVYFRKWLFLTFSRKSSLDDEIAGNSDRKGRRLSHAQQ